MNSKKQTALNLVTYIMLPFLIGVFNIIKMRVFIDELGILQNGIYQFYTSFFMYFAIVESGMELSICSTLYQYLATNKTTKINEVIAGAKIYWWRFAWMNLIIGALLLPLAPFMVGDKPSIAFVIMVQAIYTLRTTFNYFFAGPQTLTIADNRGYLVITIDALTTFISALLAIATVYLTHNLIYVGLVEVSISLVAVIFKYVYLKHKYPALDMRYSKKKSFEFTRFLRGTLTNKVTDMLINNSDIFLVTVIFGVEVNSWFAIFISFAVILVSIFGTSVTASMQSLLGKNFAAANHDLLQKQKSIRLLKWFNYLVMALVVPLIALALNPFIAWFYGVQQVAPFSFYVILLIFIYVKLFRTPYATLKVASGHYNIFIPYAVADAILKIVLSLFFMRFFGVSGVLLGTIVAYIVSELWLEAREFDIKILQKSWGVYALEVCAHFGFTLFLSVMLIVFVSPLITNFARLLIICFIVALILGSFLIGFSLFISKDVRAFTKNILGKNGKAR